MTTVKSPFATVEEAIEDIRRREQVAEAEARSGALQGFHAITEDPEYLAEWSASAHPRDQTPAIHRIEADPDDPQADAMPTWNAGDEFEAARKRALAASGTE